MVDTRGFRGGILRDGSQREPEPMDERPSQFTVADATAGTSETARCVAAADVRTPLTARETLSPFLSEATPPRLS